MATTPQVSENAATQRQYVSQLTISAALAQAIRTLWAATSPVSSDAAWDSFSAAVHAVVPQFSNAAAVTSLDNYRATRLAAGITDVPPLPRITSAPVSKIDAGLDWAQDLRRIADEQAVELAEIEAKILGRVDAAMQKVLADEAREITVAAVAGDEKALGFRRVPRPDACAWCLALAIRTTTRKGLAADFKRYGPGTMGGDEHWGVFKSRASAGQLPEGAADLNRFHNHCNCVVEPIFDHAFVPADWLVDVAGIYDDADDFNHFRRTIEARRRGEVVADPRPELPAPSVNPAQVVAIADLLGGINAAMRAA